MARLVKALPAVVSALLLSLAFPPFNWGLMVFFALVPWFASLRTAGRKGSFKSGYVFGFAFLLGEFHWIDVLTDRWTQSPTLGLVPWILCCFLGAFYFGLVGWLIWICWQRRWPLAIPMAWVGVEVFRCYIPVFAFPYALLPLPLWQYPVLIQSAQFGLIFFVSGWIALCNVIVAQAVLRQRYDYVAWGLFSLVLGASFALAGAPIKGTPVRVTVGQPGIDSAFGDRMQNSVEIPRRVSRLEEDAVRNDSKMLILPEGIADDGPLPLNKDLPTLYGGQRGENPRYQSAFAVEGGVTTYADKTRLVIFGEFVPLRHVLPFLSSFNLPTGDLQPGETLQTVKLDGVTVGPVICFEGLFPDIAYRQSLKGAQMLAEISVDDWYMGTGAPEQLRSASVFRAVETGLPLVRSATLGYSMAVNQRGVVIAEAPLGQAMPLTVDLTLPDKRSTLPWKFAFPLLAFLFLPFLIVVRMVERVRSKA